MSKTHLTLSDRVRIQSGLDKSESFKKIAEAIGKDCTTVSREVRNHFVVERTGGHGKGYNVIAGTVGAAYKRPDGVHVFPLTSLKP